MNDVLALQMVDSDSVEEMVISWSTASNSCSSGSNSNCTNGHFQ